MEYFSASEHYLIGDYFISWTSEKSIIFIKLDVTKYLNKLPLNSDLYDSKHYRPLSRAIKTVTCVFTELTEWLFENTDF